MDKLLSLAISYSEININYHDYRIMRIKIETDVLSHVPVLTRPVFGYFHLPYTSMTQCYFTSSF